MPPASELFSTVLRLRLDVILFAIATLAACGVCRRRLRQRATLPASAGITPRTIAIFIVASALLADGAALVLGYPTSAPLGTVVLARAAILGTATLFGAVLLVAAFRLALLRTELRQHADAGRQLEQAKFEADEASRAKSEFLAVMSHEIRTPLNAIMGFATLLADSRLDDAQRGYVTTITSEGARLSGSINDILDLTKIEKGSLILERLPFAPAEIAQEVLRLLNPRAADKAIDLRFEAHLAGPLLVAGDPLRFRQIIINLVDNALKFTPRGSVTLFMTWHPPVTPAPHGQLSIRVCDTGIGIPADKLKDIFQMFAQADSSTTRRYGGTGLGLAICQRLVMLMGGEITVRSTPGEGSEFSFALPLAPFAVPGVLASAEPKPLISRLPAPRILVVDDMETNRFLLEVFLRRNGFEPQLAAGGEEAVRLVGANRYDAILMDLQMPDIDGYTATRRIRATEPSDRRTPIIALTASLAKGTREKCLAAGMDEHLTKPLDLRKFRNVLNTFVRASSETAPLAS